MNPMRSVTRGDTWEVTGRDVIQADRSHFVLYVVVTAGGFLLLCTVMLRVIRRINFPFFTLPLMANAH